MARPSFMVRFGLTLLCAAILAPHALADYCATCLEEALGSHNRDTYESIQKAWSQYKHVLEIVRKIEASGNADAIAQAHALLAKAEATWKPYEAMARDYASPKYVDYLDSYQDTLNGDLESAKERIHHETDLFAKLSKTTLNDERQRIINELTGYDKEAQRMRATFLKDTILGSLATASSYLDLYKDQGLQIYPGHPPKGWDEMVTQFMTATAKKRQLTSELGNSVARNAGPLDKLLNSPESRDRIYQSVQLVSDSGLAAIRAVLAAKPALAAATNDVATGAASRAGLVQLAAPVLDCALLAQAYGQYNDTEAGLKSVEVRAHHWEGNIKAEGRAIHRTERRLALLQDEKTYQTKIADLYASIQAAKEATP